MTSLEYVAQALQIALSTVLIVRLLSLRLHAVYLLFSFFLLAELFGSLSWVIQWFLRNSNLSIDYRLVFVAQRIIVCTLVILTVYALLDAVMKTLPGLLTMARRVLNWTFLISIVAGVFSAAWEYYKSGYGSHTAWQARVMFSAILADRVVSSVVLLVIVSILIFLLWFPVRIPQNLAVFITGFAVYSAGSSAGLLVQSLLVHDISRRIGVFIDLLISCCFAYWIFFITSAGEERPTRLNLARDPREEDRLIRSLEEMNESLVRGSHR